MKNTPRTSVISTHFEPFLMTVVFVFNQKDLLQLFALFISKEFCVLLKLKNTYLVKIRG